MSLQLRKAERKQAKLRIGLSAPSGAGKTYSALLLASGIASSWDKIALIDTESGSGELYAHLGDYNVIQLEAPFSPERYIEAIQACEEAGMEVIITDSITHEWEGEGGCLDIHSKMTGNGYTNWSIITPRHQRFINTMLSSKCHIISCVRRKQDYEMQLNEKGKQAPVKVGLKEITREGFEYELTINFTLEVNHQATASKDRTGLFMDKPPFIINEETGKQLIEWCNNGEVIKTPTEEIKEADSIESLVRIWTKYKSLQTNLEFVKVKDKRKEELISKTE